MKKTVLTLALLTALAACNRGAANNVADNQTAGLPVPPERSATPPAATDGNQQAAMPAGLDCLRNRLSPEERRGAAAVAMEQGSADDPRFQSLRRAVDACGDELSWSSQKRRLAGMFSMSAAGAAGIREELGARGIRFDDLDQAILSDQPLMQAAATGQLGGPVAQQFAARHADLIQRMAGGEALDEALGTRIGNYIAFRALAETTASQFGREP